MTTKNDLVKITDYLWEIPQSYRPDMRVPARIYATEKMLEEIGRDRSLEQLVNMTTMPGIQGYALAMPDVHEGYGACIGGIFATDVEGGAISPGSVGYDVNCGIRLLRSEKTSGEVKPHLSNLAQGIYREVPAGVGRGGRLKLRVKELDQVLQKGAKQMIGMGYGSQQDLERLESNGCLEEANPDLVTDLAKKRGHDQIGTMGAGNHFVEVGIVESVLDEQEANKLGLFQNQVTVLIHTGSRGLGHQVATDYIRQMVQVMPKYGITLPDRELACAPFQSPEGQNYFQAMSAAANFAWANRQLITWEVRKAWEEVLGASGGQLAVVYDVAHNIAKVEEYEIHKTGNDRQTTAKTKLVVHRKGATRSFPNQPVLIPGSMGTGSYVLVGQPKAMAESFGSSCHGAGRRLSRAQAKREIRGDELKKKLNQQGIVIQAGSMSGLAEEAPAAYKNVDEVVQVVHQAGLAKMVARLKPIAVVKG